MKVKVDENLPASVASLLRGRGVDADSVLDEALTGTPDADLLRAADKEGRMIFTLDRGFGDIRSYPPGTHPGIVVFRLDDEAAASARTAVTRLIETIELDDLAGASLSCNGALCESAARSPDGGSWSG